ncbi:MAG: YidC/Oxa1 family membrane protein insertase [Acidimicrobiia bacterium]|nr:YidC/Oxa1 family membrane protein insertase [Acidimicrobiia bacterium]MBT8248578.1 YidC/Oxa1 family membrane protein insertase [Acidimicrobiia bacterium]
MLDPIIEFLGAILSFLYQIFPNVGLAIILLTVVVNLAMFPLTLKQTRSMKAMQEIQPLVKDLQKKYKDDRQQLNEEMVALYKEKGVNPAAGCLPMIIQLPIWFSLFRLLQSFRPGDADNTRFLSAESNLGEAISAGDTSFLGMDMVVSPSEAISDGIGGALPYILLVVFIIVTGYYQQAQLTKRRKKDGSDVNDTPQARQMQTFTKVLPVVFGFISYTLLAGVDLYIASGQVVRIGQQAFIIRLDERHAAQAAAAPVPEPEPEEKETPTKKDYQGSKKKQQKRRRRY